jgi:hypothetical protein
MYDCHMTTYGLLSAQHTLKAFMKFFHFWVPLVFFCLLSELKSIWKDGLFCFHDSYRSNWICSNLLNETLCLKQLGILTKHMQLTLCWHRGRPRVQRLTTHQQNPDYRPFRKHLQSRRSLTRGRSRGVTRCRCL